MIYIQHKTDKKVILSDGKTFIPKPQLGCGGCAFRSNEGDYKDICETGLTCSGYIRPDGNSVIWVEKKSQNQPHPYAELIKAWADGEKIEEFDPFRETWVISEHPSWDIDISYRIAKKQKQDVVKYFVASQEKMIQCTFDGETGKLKSVEMVNKND